MEEINLKEFLIYLKKYIFLFIIAITTAVAGAYFYNAKLKTPLYKAESSIVLYQSSDAATGTANSSALNDISAGQKLVSTYSELIKSDLILQQVIDDLKLGEELTVGQLNNNVSVTSGKDTMILDIAVKDKNPERAALIANKIAETFTSKTTERFALENISVWGEAKTPSSPANIAVARDLAAAALLAVFGVLALAFVIFYFDDTVKYSEDLGERIGLPIAGRIIKSDVTRRDEHKAEQDSTKNTHKPSRRAIPKELLIAKYPKSVVSESIKSLRTNLQFASVDHDLKTILVTSSLASEGKSFVASNLAASFAQTDKSVLLVDADLRKGRLHKIFDLDNLEGLSNLLANNIHNYRDYIQHTPVKNLDVITRGTIPPNPSELLSSQKNKAFIKLLKQTYDIIIFDGTPCNGITDSVIMSTLVDETLIVVKDSNTTYSMLNATKDALKKVDAKIAGIVPNCVNRKVAKYYTYYGENDKK